MPTPKASLRFAAFGLRDSNLGSKEWGRGFSTHLLPGVKKKNSEEKLSEKLEKKTQSTQSKYLENPGTDRNRFQRDLNIHSIRFQQDLNIYSIRFHEIQNIYSAGSWIYKAFTQPGSSRCPASGLLTP